MGKISKGVNAINKVKNIDFKNSTSVIKGATAIIFGYEPPEMKSDFCKKDYKNAFAKSISNIVKNPSAITKIPKVIQSKIKWFCIKNPIYCAKIAIPLIPFIIQLSTAGAAQLACCWTFSS